METQKAEMNIQIKELNKELIYYRPELRTKEVIL